MKLAFPFAVLAQHLVVLGKTGAGKSSALRHIVEYLLSQGKRVCVVDPKGDWNGLKVAADGRGQGYPVILFGDFKEVAGKSIPADVPLNEYSGKHIAELVTSGNRPCVIGLRGWTQAGMHRFWIEFASTFFNTNEGEIYLVVDEVHNFAPKGTLKGKEGNVGTSLHWTNRLLSEARGLGAVMLIASQRPQKVHNDTLTACETLVAMRVIHKADRDAIEDWIKGNGDKDLSTEILNSLAGMKRGEAYVWSPEVEFGPTRLTFPMFETFDSFAPPQLQKKVSGKDWASVDLDVVRQKLSAVIEKAKSEDPNELNKIIGGLKKEISELKRNAAPRQEDTNRIKELTEQLEAERAKVKPAGKPEVKVKKIIVAADLTRLENEGDRVAVLVRESGQRTIDLEAVHEKIRLSITEAKELNAQTLQVVQVPVPRPQFVERKIHETASVARVSPPAKAQTASASSNGDGQLAGIHLRIVNALAELASFGVEQPSRNQLGFYMGNNLNSGYGSRAVGELKTTGLVDYPSGGRLALTTTGFSQANQFEAPTSLVEFHDRVRRHLAGLHQTVFDYLIPLYPNGVHRKIMGEKLQKNFESGYGSRTVGELKTAGLLEYPRSGEVAASKLLFPPSLAEF